MHAMEVEIFKYLAIEITVDHFFQARAGVEPGKFIIPRRPRNKVLRNPHQQKPVPAAAPRLLLDGNGSAKNEVRVAHQRAPKPLPRPLAFRRNPRMERHLGRTGVVQVDFRPSDLLPLISKDTALNIVAVRSVQYDERTQRR